MYVRFCEIYFQMTVEMYVKNEEEEDHVRIVTLRIVTFNSDNIEHTNLRGADMLPENDLESR